MKTLKDILPDISDWNEKDIVNEHHIPFGVKNKYDKTLHDYPLWKNADCGDGWNGEYSSKVIRYHLQEVAKEWLMHIKDNERKSGFKIGDDWIEFSSCVGGEYNPATSPDYTLELFIKHFFNLDVEDESRNNTR